MAAGRRSAGVALALTLAAGLAVAPVVQAQARSAAAEGRRLDAALADLQQRGLKVIFSSEVVRPSMRVVDEPRSSSPRRALDALLEPHGLIAQDGPGGTVLVVKNPRARLLRRTTPTVGAPSSAATPLTAPRYEETIHVVDAAAGGTTAGPPALTLQALDVQNVAGGFDNVFRTLTTLPGVTGTDELGSRMAVRGGAPDQNLTVMDGIEIHNPFRLVVPSEDLALVGLASTFNPATIDKVEFFPGAFDVAHGDRLSSLLRVTSREGSQAEAFQGTSAVSLGDANLVVEGALPGRADGSWLVSARRTYLGLIAEQATGTALPTFTDVQVRASWKPSAARRLALVALAGRERLRPLSNVVADAESSAASRNTLVGLTFESSIGTRSVSRTIASYTDFADALDAFEQSLDNSRGSNTVESIAQGGLLQFRVARRIAVRDLALRHDVMFVPSPRHWVNLGADLHQLDTRWAWNISGDRSQQQPNGSSIRLGAMLPGVLDSTRSTTRGGAWLTDRWQVAPRLAVEPGVRLDYSTMTARMTVSPRLSAVVQLGRGWRIDGALRGHAQSPGYEKMLQSDYFVDLSPERSRGLKVERALQGVVGVQRPLPGGFTARLDTYYKRYDDLLIGRLETDDQRLVRLSAYDVPAELWPSVRTSPQITTLPVNQGRGRAYGIEAHVVRGSDSHTPVTGRLTYSFGRATRTEYGVTRPFDYDRRHGLTATLGATLRPRLDLSVTGRVSSGLPRTPVVGVRLALTEDLADGDGDGNRTELVPQRDGQGGLVFQPDLGDLANVNAGRLPRFARVDARLTFRPSWGGERWAFYGDVINIFNGRNITQIDSMLALDPAADRPQVLERAQDRGIPFFPSVGLRFWF